MNILKRDLAPVSDAAWSEIDDMAKDILTANLSARKVVDVTGPRGLSYAGINLGSLSMGDSSGKGEVQYGVCRVQPLVEARIIFPLDIWELDNVERGAKDIQLDALIDASKKIAAFEETAVYKGFKPGNITGIHAAGALDKKISIKIDNNTFLDGVAEAQSYMQAEGIDGGADLVVNPTLWKFLGRVSPGGSLRNLVEKQIEGKVVYSSFVEDALLVANRGGDTELALGQDISIGYHHHTSEQVFLFLTESFTFRVITPEAVVSFAL